MACATEAEIHGSLSAMGEWKRATKHGHSLESARPVVAPQILEGRCHSVLMQRHIAVPLAFHAAGFRGDVQVANAIYRAEVRFSHLQDFGDARAVKAQSQGPQRFAAVTCSDSRFGECGCSLLECLQHIPALRPHLSNFGVLPMWARGRVDRKHELDGSYTTTIHLQPADQGILAAIYDRIWATDVDALSHLDFPSGRQYRFTRATGSSSDLIVPNGVCIGSKL